MVGQLTSSPSTSPRKRGLVRQLSGIKLRSMWEALRAQTYVLVLSIIAYIYGLIWIGVIAIGLATAGLAGAQAMPLLLPLAGSLYTLGWIVVPVVLASQEGTLDPIKLTPYVSNSSRLALALIIVGGVGVGGVYFLLVQIGAIVGWAGIGGGLGLWSAILGAVLGSLVALVWFKALGTWLGRRKATKTSAKDRAGLIIGVLFLVVFIPSIYLLPDLLENLDLSFWLSLLPYLKWTPFGAPWFLPAAAVENDWTQFAVLILISAVTIALGWWLMRAMLGPAMVGKAAKITPAIEDALRAGRTQVDPTATQTEHVRAGEVPQYLSLVDMWQRLGISGPTAAVAARTQIYWLKDSRLSVQSLSSLTLIIVAVIMDKSMAYFPGMSFFFVILAAFVLGRVLGTLLQYDSTAFWLHVSTGIRGAHDRLGRFLGSAIFMVPALLVATVVFGILVGMAPGNIALLAVASLLVFSCGATATSIIGSQWVYPVQPPGTSAMSTKGTGQFGITLLIGLLQFAVTALFAALPAGLLVWSLSGGTALKLIAALVAIAWSCAIIWLSVWWGGKILDRSEVEILTKIRNWPGHGVTA
ncbi:hypothetical protein [Scrofimicrobium canadense]|uniref:hypothetical protein n=1 Tax=Scrofimicrobium canadense TaxID=2652290 RepID=UPI00197EB2CC|nr:hypothetical protein [Scrofimicrobium canadense]